ncbi:MAG: DUF2812 domain-containing protein [Clostridia bacterium]|nr:DUF2812 domain-containing protein [Clostridia bacterium]
MRKKCYRFFGALLTAQSNWLNKLSEKGFRLIRAGKLLYEFEPCAPGQYQYQVEFVADKSKDNAEDYVHFLEDIGYRVFFKNINLNYSVGKFRWRPWAEQGGVLSISKTTFNHELLIVEKTSDGKPFELRTTYEDKAWYCRRLQKPWLFLFLAAAIVGIFMRTWIWGILSVTSFIVLMAYQAEYTRVQKLSKEKEW